MLSRPFDRCSHGRPDSSSRDVAITFAPPRHRHAPTHLDRSHHHRDGPPPPFSLPLSHRPPDHQAADIRIQRSTEPARIATK